MADDAVKEKLLKDELIKDRDYLNRRLKEMEVEYSTFKGHHKELSEFIDPRRGRFFVQDHNKGDKRHKNIINNKATRALRKATAGMFAGMMSPSRPWFDWTLMDEEQLSYEPNKYWLSLLRRVVLFVFAKSNFYNMAPLAIRETLLFGTACMTHVDDFDDVARFYTHTAGSYFIGQNHKLSVDTLARKFQMQAGQIVGKWGLNNVSQSVKTQYDRGQYGSWHTVCQMIELNPHRDGERAQLNSEFLPFRSVYFEPSLKNASNSDIFLSRKGFKGFPVYAPRWELAETDVYAVNCPGMTNLGDIKQLQTQEKEKAKAIAKSSTPPLQGPPSLRSQPIPNIPGGVTINAAVGTGQKLESVYTVDPKIQEMLLDIDATERRIDEGFFVDLFMAITNMQGIQPKNELQLSQINAERLLMIGPALEQIHGEWLERAVRRVAKQVLEAGIMPDAPKPLQGKELDIEFTSALAQAQKTVAIGGIERTVSFAAQMTEAGFDVSDKINSDYTLEKYAELNNAPPRIIVPDAEAHEKRRQKAELENRQRQMEAAAQAANIAKMASESKLDDENVLSSAVGRS